MKFKRFFVIFISLFFLLSTIATAKDVAVMLPLTDAACRDLERKLAKRGYRGVVLDGTIGGGSDDRDTHYAVVRYWEPPMEVGMSKRLGIILKFGEIQRVKEME
jgi:hypothetical protein